MDKNICEHLRINTKTLLFSVSIRLEAAAASEPEPKTKSQGCSEKSENGACTRSDKGPFTNYVDKFWAFFDQLKSIH